jgi:hypothetical protein
MEATFAQRELRVFKCYNLFFVKKKKEVVSYRRLPSEHSFL